jgi:hypothetical protein
MTGDWLGDKMRVRLGRGASIPAPAAPVAADPAPPEPTPAESGGFGGGAPPPVAPDGERWDDEMRRRAFGG